MKVIITVNLLFKIRPVLSGPTHTPASGSLTAFTTWTWWPLLARHKYPSPLCRFLCHLALFQWSLATRLLIKIAVLFQVGFNLLLDFSKQGQVSAAQFLIIWQSTYFFPLTNHYLSFQTIKLWQREFLPKLLVENGLRFPPVLQRKDLEHILQVMVAWWRWQWSKNHFSIKGHGAGKSSLTSKFKNVGLSADLATYNLCDF